MGYQALLFCPDEKTARPVTQVLSELDFSVTPCNEPFAAVKKLMAEHFDAIVVDCDNEQNATLLFRSARNTAQNQSALAVAVVEGQAGVAKAFRIGANLVLTKPINVEQAKGTLRVARGLLRKSEGAKAGAAGVKPSATVQDAPRETANSHVDVAPPVTSKSFMTAVAATEQSSSGQSASSPNLTKTRPERIDEVPEEIISSLRAKPASETHAQEVALANPEAKPAIARSGFGMSTASAPAPARDSKAGASSDNKSSNDKLSPAAEAKSDATALKVAEQSAVEDRTSLPAPSLTFGGTISADAEPASGGGKKWIVAAVAVVLIAAGSYAAWMRWGRSNDSSNAPDQVVESPVKTSTAVPPAAPASNPASSTPAASTAEKPTARVSKGESGFDSSKPSPAAAVVSKPPTEETTEAEAEPIVIKSEVHKPAVKVANSEPPALSITGIAPAGNGGLPNLLDSPNNSPTPVLQTLNVSKGVSQGLLIKQVQPKYPSSALRLRTEGGVELLATISKNGNISAVKIISGDKELAHAAADAVKQWKYKPYLLNGSPVEIQTQITVNFKLPK